MANTSHIELHKDVIAVKKALREARLTLEELVHSHYRMREIEKNALHQEYDKHFKHLEIQIQRKALLHSELQRRAELLMMKHQRGEKLTSELIALIHKMVDKEYAALKSRMQTLLSEQSRSSRVQEKSQEHASITKLYKDLAKKLHPDSCTNSELTKSYWLPVQDAYEHRDLHALHALHTLLCNDAISAPVEETPADFSLLQSELEKVEQLIEKEQIAIQSLRKQIPFCYELGLQDASWIEKHTKTLEEQIRKYESEIARSNDIIRMLTGHSWNIDEEEIDALHPENKAQRDYNEEFIDATYFSGRH